MFSGNTALLVASPTLQDYLVDKTTGLPLAAGVVTFYQDAQRQTLKNVYTQQGTPGAYTYTALPNPLTLSAVGTIQDNNGNDVIPFFYPYDETDQSKVQTYYVTVYSSAGLLQFTRQNFPFVPPSTTPIPGNAVISNYLTNNLFWRNTGNADLSSQTNFVLAPGNHDGFTNPDIRYLKNKTGATDSITYTNFATNPSLSDVTPAYYMNVVCSGATTGETQKCVQFPIQLNVRNLQNAQMTFSIIAMGTGTITLYLYQFLGTGASTQPAPILQGTGSITLNSTFTQYQVPVVFPTFGTASAPSVSLAGDDAFYLQIEFPHNTTFNISFYKPALYLGGQVPSSQFSTYDQIDAIIGTPRSGDIRLGLNTFSYATPYMGWLPMNDTTIGSAASVATTNSATTFQLYSTLWNNVSNTYAPVSGGRGVSASADFLANKTLALTKTLGRVLAGVGLPSSGTNQGITWALGQATAGGQTSGSGGGNEQATVSLLQMPNHTHDAPVGSGGQFVATGGTNNSYSLGANGQNFATTGAPTGYTSQVPLLTQPPTTYLNVFIKL